MYIWDAGKAASNLRKHGVPFRFAVRVFEDPDRVEFDASRASDGEPRRKCVGLIEGKLYVVVFTERGPDRRIISARRTNRREEMRYGDATNDT
jgi:uncharacterized DUF497 family protein